MYSIEVVSNVIRSLHNGEAIPTGNIGITDEQHLEIKSLKQQARESGANLGVLWNDGSPTLEQDARPVVEVRVNDQVGTVVVVANTDYTITISAPSVSDGIKIIDIFGKLVRFGFSGGTATRTIQHAESGEYVFDSNKKFRVNRLRLRVVE